MTTFALAASPQDNEALDLYLHTIVHQWAKTLTALGFTLIPIFFLLDYFMMPAELLPRFALYRLVATVAVTGQYLLLRMTKPGPLSHLHGYFFSAVVGGSIALMTTHLGGFDSTYYAGLNLVLIATTLLLPWRFHQALTNALITVCLYLLLNLAFGGVDFTPQLFINNMYFMLGTAVIVVAINYVHQRLIRQEFFTRRDLATARDALWGEMEIAKHIQTSLLPRVHELPGYRLATAMLPADEVGGDYYDIIETATGEVWIAVGDVSGHGVESGLIMMMTQTSIVTAINHDAGQEPSLVLQQVNGVIKQNISRLATDRYMTLTLLRLDGDRLRHAGKHQDILVYRHRTGQIEAVPTEGIWIGVLDDIAGVTRDSTLDIERGDLILLFTDGLTEAMNKAGEMFGEERLGQTLRDNAAKDVGDIVSAILSEVNRHMEHQHDDISLVVLRRTDEAR